MDSTIETPRLRLTLLKDTDLESNHVKWFHELRTDEVAMGWSIRGTTKSLPESRDLLNEHLTIYSSISYAVHIKPSASNHPEARESSPRYDPVHGELIGEIALRLPPDAGPTLPPPPPPTAPSTNAPSPTPTPTTASSSSSSPTDQPLAPLPPNPTFRILGYAFLPSSWGSGYATEANAALLSAYSAFCRKSESGSTPTQSPLHYVEAGVDRENPASLRVVEKLGFEKVGWHVTDGPVFLAGKWREPGYWIYGKYV